MAQAPDQPIEQPTQPASQDAAWPQLEPELLATLPAVLRAVVRALGFSRAWKWLTDHGGINIYVPVGRGQALGLSSDELGRLREALGPHLDASNRVWMPKCDKLFILVRNEQMRRERHTASIAALALRYNLTSRHVLNICREEEDRQIDLF